MKYLLAFGILLAAATAETQSPKLRGRDLATRPLMRSAGGMDNGGDGSGTWTGGSFANNEAGLQKFYFNWEGSGDKHVKDVAVDCQKDKVTMTFQDNSETDNYYYSHKAVELPSPYTTGWITVNGKGCGTSYGEVIPAGKYPVMTGFAAGFLNGDHHLDEFKMRISEYHNSYGQNVVKLYGCMNDKNNDDPFEIRVHYALIPESKIVEYGYTGQEHDGGGADTTKLFPNGIPYYAAPVLTGFYFNYEGRTDHEIDRMEVDLSNDGKLDGYVDVRYHDGNSDDNYWWHVWGALITA